MAYIRLRLEGLRLMCRLGLMVNVLRCYGVWVRRYTYGIAECNT